MSVELRPLAQAGGVRNAKTIRRRRTTLAAIVTRGVDRVFARVKEVPPRFAEHGPDSHSCPALIRPLVAITRRHPAEAEGQPGNAGQAHPFGPIAGKVGGVCHRAASRCYGTD